MALSSTSILGIVYGNNSTSGNKNINGATTRGGYNTSINGLGHVLTFNPTVKLF
jgi:hypothetical protein